MRILFCTLDYAPRAAGGAEHQARLQAEELARRGHEVHVTCPRRGREGSGQVGAVAVHRLWCIERRPFQTISTALSLAVFLLRHARRFDIVHVHLADLRTDTAVAVCRLFRKPVYVKLAAGGPAGDIGKLRRKARLTRYFGLRHAACLQAISAEIEADILRLGIARTRIATIPNGIDTAVFRPISGLEKAALRRRLDLPADRPVVLYQGRFAAYKGLGDLLAAWSRVRTVCEADLVFAGSVAVEDPFAIPEGLPGVTVRSWTSEPSTYLQAADVFVLPSHVEGMSNALLEAMACGLPVVATAVGAAPQMIAHGKDGVLVPAGDSDALFEALSQLLADPALRSALGQAAAHAIVNRYALTHVVDEIEARYRAIARPPAGPRPVD